MQHVKYGECTNSFRQKYKEKEKQKKVGRGLWVKQKSETERDNMVNDDEKKYKQRE